MNKQQYAEYEASVAAFFEREGIDSLTACDEPGFSWVPCDCCGSPLGGDRYVAQAYHAASDDIVTYEVCPDCIYYAEYGRLDDMTMLDIEGD